MSTDLYQIRDLKKSYSPFWKLEIDHLDISNGGIFCLLGPNGAGKSTLLRLLHFLESWDAGVIRFRGEQISMPARSESRKAITMLFQRPLMLKGTIRRNVTYGLKLQRREIDNELADMLEQLELRGRLDENVRSLSGGDIQRVALARALALSTQVLLLDEPTANLDPYNTRLIESIIKEISTSQDRTVILVTHNVFQARRLADHGAFILNGRIVEQGDMQVLFNQPQDHRTKAFIEGDLVS